jgi:hypothetical protein
MGPDTHHVDTDHELDERDPRVTLRTVFPLVGGTGLVEIGAVTLV